MRGNLVAPVLLAATILGVSAFAAAGRMPVRVNATGTGPTLMVGGASLVNGTVQVPIRAWYPVTDPYGAFSIHLRWDPAVFGFSSASGTGGVFDPSTGTGTCFVNTAAFDGDGGGVIFACTGYAGTTQSYHLLATISLSPAAAGCSALHLYTYGAPDGGDSSSGTFTVNDADSSPQANFYWDGTSDVGGHACTPRPGAVPAPPAPGPITSGPVSGNCTTDLNGDGSTDTIDLAEVGKAFISFPGDPKWNSKADLNADAMVNTVDLARVGKNFLVTLTGCVPGYPFYNPGSTWAGALGSYSSSSYLILTGAMLYQAGSYDCSGTYPSLSGWAFISPAWNGLRSPYLSACAFATNLTVVEDHVNHLVSNQVFFGPNDCMTSFLPPNGSTIAGAAATLHAIWQIATNYATSHFYSIQFQAVVDNEGYFGVCDPNHTAEPYCQTPDLTFFTDYAGAVGPAGAYPCLAADENALSQAGGGSAIALVYVYTGAMAQNPGPPPVDCTYYDDLIPPVQRSNDGSWPYRWPYTIPAGYAGVQSYPTGSSNPPFYTSWDANIRWSLCHGGPPATDFDWSNPGGRQ